MCAARGERLTVRRALVLGLVDVVTAALIATFVFRLFGASSQDDTNPPVCSNAAGRVVSCELTQTVLMLPAFGVALFVLVTWQVRRWRNPRPKAGSGPGQRSADPETPIGPSYPATKQVLDQNFGAGQDLLRGRAMFEAFRAEYGPSRDDVPSGSAWEHELLAGVAGYTDFAAEFAGATFARGAYRVHDGPSGAQAMVLVAEAFPEFAGRVCPFGYDWLGRQFAVDVGRIVVGQPQVLLLEPGTGEALDVPASFAAFHDEVLIEYPDAALATEFFEIWSSANGDNLPLSRGQCVGYRIPLFLGGQDAIENLELTDMQVYWSICGQLRSGALSLPPGTSINEVAARR